MQEMSPRQGESSEAAQLRRQLEEMQRSFEEANAARETAMEELKATKRQVELAEAARQLHDAEARSQAVRAVTEMQKLAERRVTQAEEEAEKQIQEAERRAEEQVRAVQEESEQRLQSVQQQTEGIAAATRKLHDAEARRQALRAVSEVQKMADQRLRSEKQRMDEMIAAAHEASSLQIKSAHDKAEMQIKTVQAQAEELAAARVTVTEAEHAAKSEREMREAREAYETRIEETRRQYERERGEQELQTEHLIASTIADAENQAATTRKEVEERVRAEAERAIQDAQAAAAAERAAVLRTAEETKAQGEEMMRLSEQAVALERESREAAEQRIAEEAEARARAEEYASQAARQVQVAQVRLKAASEGALMARRALAAADSPEASKPATSEVGAAVQAYIDATAGEAKPITNEIDDLSLGEWTLRRGPDGSLVWTGVRQDDLPENGATEHTATPANVRDALLWVLSLTSLTDGMHAPLFTWLQQLYPAEPDTAASPGGDGVDAASFALLQQRCEFIEHWARTVAQHGPEMEQLIITKNEGDPAFSFLSDRSSMEGQYYMECMSRFTGQPAAPSGDYTTEVDKVSQLIADHEAALRALQQEAQNGQLSPAAVAKIEQVTASISKLTTHLDRLERAEVPKRAPRRSSSRPKSAKRASSRGKQRQNLYTHGQSVNRHARPEMEPRRPRPKTPSTGRNGTTTPGRQGARTPGRQGARTPGRQGARTPGRQGATTPGRQGARTPGQRGTTPRGGTTPRAGGKSPRKSRPGSASGRSTRGSLVSQHAGPVRVQPSGKERAGRGSNSTAHRHDAMELVNAEAEAFSRQSKGPPMAPAPAPEPEPEEEAAPAPKTPKADAKRAQSNPRSLFRRRAAKQTEEASAAGAAPVAVEAASSVTPEATLAEKSDLRLVTSTPSAQPLRTNSGISLPHSSPVPLPHSQPPVQPSGDLRLDAITTKLRALSYGVAGQDPSKLFRRFDRDKSGELELAEFATALRKGAQLTSDDMSDEELRTIFDAADIDGDGTINIEELTQFVWGYASPRGGASPIDAAEKKAREKESRRLIAKQRQIPEKVKQLRVKLTALSYGATGQDPALLFKQYDRDNSGELDIAEFSQAIRKGGRMTKNDITDGELRQLFRSIDDDRSGTISIEEMTEFVWGTAAGSQLPAEADEDGPHNVTMEDICETIVQQVRRASIRITDIFQRVEQENKREGFPVYSPGELDIAGLGQAVFLMGIELQVDELSLLFNGIDTNGDQLVSVQEFIQFIRRRGRPDLSPLSSTGSSLARRPKSAKRATVGRIQQLYTGDAQSRDKKLREKRMQIKQAEEEELRKASVPWHQQEEYKKRQKKFPVADGAAMHDRFDTWQARKQERVEQKRAKIEQEKQNQSRTPKISSRSKQMQSGRSGNVVENLHQWDAAKKDKLKMKKEDLERAQMHEITLTPKMEKSFSKRKDLKDLEADVHGHTASHIRMHAKIRRDVELSPGSKKSASRRVGNGSVISDSVDSVDSSNAPAQVDPSPPHDDAEEQGTLVELQQPVPALATSEVHEFDTRADRLAAEMQEAEAMLATGFDDDSAGQVEAAFGTSGEAVVQTGNHEHVVLSGHVLALPDKAERHALFDRIDYNGNGALSLAEIDKAVCELWPQFDHKRALMRAYKAADRNDDGFIKRGEFSRLLKFIVYFNELWDRFEEIDRNHDHRLNLDEFIDGCAVVGLELEDAEFCFNEIDSSGGGFILFDEFCSWCAHYHVGEELEVDDEVPETTEATPEAVHMRSAVVVVDSAVEPAEPAEPVDEPEQASLESMQAEAEAQRAKFKAEQRALGLESSDDDESDEPEAAGSGNVHSVEPPSVQEAQQFDDRAGQLAAEMEETKEMLAAAAAVGGDAVGGDYASIAAMLSACSTATTGPSQVQQELEALVGGSTTPGSPSAGVAAGLVPVGESSMGDALSRIPVAKKLAPSDDAVTAQTNMEQKMAEMDASIQQAAATGIDEVQGGNPAPAAVDDYESFLNSFDNN